MKRRLSVGISMVGNPRIVFLDEPTTGLDPENRRHLWQVLNKCKQKRALFLTTHLMEEADALCNRIGIITHGVLRTVGTQQRLKRVYGSGYFLSMNIQLERAQPFEGDELRDSESELEHKESIMTQNMEYKGSAASHAASNNLKKIKIIKGQIERILPYSRLDREINGFLRFNLGNVVISEVMEKLFKSEHEEIQKNWALTNSNLEDVFLSVVLKFDAQEKEEIEELHRKQRNFEYTNETIESRHSIQNED